MPSPITREQRLLRKHELRQFQAKRNPPKLKAKHHIPELRAGRLTRYARRGVLGGTT